MTSTAPNTSIFETVTGTSTTTGASSGTSATTATETETSTEPSTSSSTAGSDLGTGTETSTTAERLTTSLAQLVEGRVVLEISEVVDFAALEAPLKTWLSRLLQVSPEQISVPCYRLGLERSREVSRDETP